MKAFTRYLETKDLLPTTLQRYVKYVNWFLEWYHQDISQCTKKHILDYLHHLKEKPLQNVTRNIHFLALKYYFSFLLQQQVIVSNPTALINIRGARKKMLYKPFSMDELTELADAYYQCFIRNFDDNYIPKNQRFASHLTRHRNYNMLGVLCHQGLVTSELQKITLSHLHLQQAKLHIPANRMGAGRTLSLHASQIGGLLHYTEHIRPVFLKHCQDTDKLFIPLPPSGLKTTKSQCLMRVVIQLGNQVRTLNPRFVNFKQIRASVITHWLSRYGLRKAQYLAGHRYIGSTERYLSSELQSLTEDMTRFNPFQ